MERIDTHEDEPERHKTEEDLMGKMMNMIGSLRDELGKLWLRNSVLEKELSSLRPRENAVCDTTSLKEPQPLLRDHEGDGEKTLQPSADEGDGREAVESLDDVCPEVKCVHCEARTEKDKSCCDQPACDECDAFGKWAKKKD
jgi:hypothetical protein